MFFYNDKINNYFLHPKFSGYLDQNDSSIITVKDGSKTSGKYIIFQIKLDDSRSYIKKACYKVYGCGATIAALEWFVEKIIDNKVNILDSISIQDIVNDLDLPKIKLHCALTIEDLAKNLAIKLKDNT